MGRLSRRSVGEGAKTGGSGVDSSSPSVCKRGRGFRRSELGDAGLSAAAVSSMLMVGARCLPDGGLVPPAPFSSGIEADIARSLVRGGIATQCSEGVFSPSLYFALCDCAPRLSIVERFRVLPPDPVIFSILALARYSPFTVLGTGLVYH